ncbi:GNAT family N-acetyltransferase [Hoyosella sp. YIM 151337]|uniref:GNAT family N-acetyltransferase n=1 Tax=Hoyosella sp. YIM 151337 TaxID=2992742 RepID=UPI0022366B1D|nr:GNAT family N-acetyltransferase [Hoyosella sp. YIM 151337]MCW4354582.1 GNAT family N-acetyltransferase [Hoyosella sp. YIM 151337]
MAGPVVIREITPADYAAVSLITVESYRPYIRPDDDYFAILADTEHRASAATIVLAERDGKVLGSLTMVEHGTPYADIARPGELEFRMIAVSANARRLGVGTALVNYGIAEARKRGLQRVVLSTMDVMVEARRMYERLGFSEDPARRWHRVISVLTLPLKSQQDGADDSGQVAEARDF